VQWRARPQADLAGQRIVDTGSLRDTDRIATTGTEAMWIHGPLKLQGEYMKSTTERYRDGVDDFSGSAGYVSAVWNVTGETFGYKAGVPTTPLPSNLGGEMDTLTLGVNWYVRSNFKLMLNYVKADSSRYIGRTSATYANDAINDNRTFNAVIDDNPDILEARVQFYW
jgi:phosphate-selective porin OprO/OprP